MIENEILYKGFKIWSGEYVWYVVNLKREDFPIGDIVAELEKDEWPTMEDVKRYIDEYILGIY